MCHRGIARRIGTPGLEDCSTGFGPVKPFLIPHETVLKQEKATIPQLSEGLTMLSILNIVYREFLRASLSGAKVASTI